MTLAGTGRLLTQAPTTTLLEVTDLSVDFRTDDGVVHAVRGVSFSLEAGEVLGIVGESGSGKSVSCLAVMGLLPKAAVVSGSVRYRGMEMLGQGTDELNKVRGSKIAMVFQDPMSSLNPVYSVGWQLAEGVRAHNDVSKKQAWAKAVEMLDLVGIPQAKERAGGYPHEFSGGMRQRVMIAMAIANNPDVIIADEPTTALDVTVQAQVLETIERIKDEVNAAIVLITHDLGVVAGMADRMLVMYAGRAVELGTVDDLYAEPRMPYTLGLLGSLPRLDAEAGEALTPIKGAPPSLINLPPGCPFSPRCPKAREHCMHEEPPLLVTDRADHFAACHFWSELAEVDSATDVFEVTATDSVDVVALEAGAT